MSWSVDNSSIDGVNIWIIADGGETIAALPVIPPMFNREKQVKRAHQIAAVPELIAACRAWVDYFERLEGGMDLGDPLAEARRVYHGKRLEQTKAALAKAEPQEKP